MTSACMYTNAYICTHIQPSTKPCTFDEKRNKLRLAAHYCPWRTIITKKIRALDNGIAAINTCAHPHPHIQMYMYIYVLCRMCVCVCVPAGELAGNKWNGESKKACEPEIASASSDKCWKGESEQVTVDENAHAPTHIHQPTNQRTNADIANARSCVNAF